MPDITTLMMAAAGAGEESDDDFANTVLLLHGDGTNGAQNNTFLDSSTNNFTITRNGNTTQGSFTPFSKPDGAWGNLFDRTNYSNLFLASSADFDMGNGAGDFTIEMFIYFNTLPGGDVFYWLTGSNSQGGIFLFGANPNIYWRNAADQDLAASVNAGVTTGVWYHFAFVRSSTTYSIYKDGVLLTSGTGTASSSANQQLAIGGTIGFSNGTNGYISSYRFTRSAVYTSAFTPPSEPLTTTSQGVSSANVKLLTCQSNRFVDNSASARTVLTGDGGGNVGNPKVTPFSPFPITTEYSPSVNGGSGYFDGSGDYLSIADAAGLRFGTGNFTIQCWIYRNAAGAVHSIAAKGGASTGWVFQVHSDNKLRFTHTTTNIDSTGTIPASAWTHVAVVREGTGTNQVKLYINGVNDGQGTVSTNFTQTEQLNIGADRGNSNVMNGYIVGWKYVVGTAETITVPTAPPTGGTALLNFTNAGIFDNTGFNNLETLGNAQIDTSVKKYGTGSMEFDGTGDFLYIPPNPNNFFGTGNFTIEAWIYMASTANNFYVFSSSAAGYASPNFTFLYDNSLGLRIYAHNGAQVVNQGSTSGWSANTWYHVALVRDGNTVTVYRDGVSLASASGWSSVSLGDTTSTQVVGGSPPDSISNNGYIDDLRITKGIARYTAAFTPPTAAFPNIGS